MPLPAISALMRVMASDIGTALLTRTMPSSLSAQAREATPVRTRTSSSGAQKFRMREVRGRVIGGSCRVAHAGSMLSTGRMNAHIGIMKCVGALKSIAARYRGAMHRGYRTDWASAFLMPHDPASDGACARLAGVHVNPEEPP